MLSDIHTFHFIGIGGAGMSALARILLEKGCQVSGSDLNASPLTEQLREHGAQIKFPLKRQEVGGGQHLLYRGHMLAALLLQDDRDRRASCRERV